MSSCVRSLCSVPARWGLRSGRTVVALRRRVAIIVALIVGVVLAVGCTDASPIICSASPCVSSLAMVSRLAPRNAVVLRRAVYLRNLRHVVITILVGALGLLSLRSIARDLAFWERCRVRHGA